MDVKQYFQRVRELAMQLPGEEVVIKSLPTPNGGKAGILTEVNRQTAAKQIIDGNAVLATEKESTEYYSEMEAKRQIAERALALSRLQISLSTAAQSPAFSVLSGTAEERE
ncbi:MAG: hypothetical protein JNK48_35025 [Bryobacterales bacterium]|nr:hypothetical protein [Bryobacterales bacterium]